MPEIKRLLDNNKAWAARTHEANPTFFDMLSRQQRPVYLWIGCSDSRVPANQIVDLLPGEIFVHRNVANMVVHTDFNCLSVLQYAVDVLKVKHIIVCGHYGCGGVEAAMGDAQLGLIDNWLAHIRDIYDRNSDHLSALSDTERSDRLCELNVLAQAANVKSTNIVRDALQRNQPLKIHSWIYSLSNGHLKDLAAEG
ncbi:carbonate dehydratase [Alteromonas oceanisediminis]|uniref:carbonate dehydratase n=1 Tax=Alteromonas oceanisediminis TaxID=2836180 RepID=UPI001BDAFBBB|nr:carbonate dehydratase [Alteromonas oceanisediminis]MBT0586217.1 carbonate dehydratase [Alteromonas oceanisediminis]